MRPVRIDLNADLGEGFGAWQLGDDQGLLEIVTSANVACGFHAGDPVTMRRVCAWAARGSVAIGAQVGYRDLAGFGRRRIDISPTDLAADVLYQLGALHACATAAGSAVRYVKAHGALYHAAADDAAQAGAIAEATAAFDPALSLLGPAGSCLADAAAHAGLAFVAEAFADRGYLPSGKLVARGQPKAVIDDPDVAAARAVRFVEEGLVTAIDGTDAEISAESICVHGDTPAAVAIARAVREALTAAGVELAPFAP